MAARRIAMVVCLAVSLHCVPTPCLAQSSQLQPVNPNASAEAKRVLQFLKSIQGEKMIAGHHVMYGPKVQEEINFITRTTGKYPGIAEFEAGIFTKKYSDDYRSQQKQLVKDMTEYWNQGGVVALCWHWGNPMLPQNTYENTKIKFNLTAAMKEGTPEHAAMIKDLDITADMLKELQAANVPVLWRPLHEIDGKWFWWGMEEKEKGQALWKFIYKYYTDHHKLNNLIWVYSASHDFHMDWLPGLAYVDGVGVDIYKEGEQDKLRSYNQLKSVAGNKIIALSECDVIPDPQVMKKAGFLWNWCTTWHSEYVRKNTAETLKKFYSHELVLTRDELPNLRSN